MTRAYDSDVLPRRPFRASLLVSASLTVLVALAAPVAFDRQDGAVSWNAAFAQGQSGGAGGGTGIG